MVDVSDSTIPGITTKATTIMSPLEGDLHVVRTQTGRARWSRIAYLRIAKHVAGGPGGVRRSLRSPPLCRLPPPATVYKDANYRQLSEFGASRPDTKC